MAIKRVVLLLNRQVLGLRKVLIFTFVLVSAPTINPIMMSSVCANYFQKRDELLREEKSQFCGHEMTLNNVELEVNRILTEEKQKELNRGYKNSTEFLPSQHFFQAKERIDNSKVFEIIKKLPKGGSLHTHLLAAVSADYVIKKFTYKNHLYGGYVNGNFKLKFMLDPTQDPHSDTWTLISEMRAKESPEIFDRWLKSQLILNVDDPKKDYPNPEAIWSKFKKSFTTVYEMLCYKSVFEQYIYQLLQELYDDNVMYTELKGTIMPLHELDGHNYTKREFFETFVETVEKFKKDHPKFRGVRYIHSIYRGVDQEVLQTGLEEIIEFKKLFPDFIAGFDFVGYEEEGNSIFAYLPQLLESRKHLEFFFHAGETNWFGHTDLNMVDAILLNCSRVGHGFALTKHPKLFNFAKQSNICLEICPISNQVLMLNDDPRNHPASTLMALDYPVVICNDDPSIWNATGLSYDWYIAFMAMTPREGGLEILKQLAVNSIVYSSMTEEEKRVSLKEWEEQWNVFLYELSTKF